MPKDFTGYIAGQTPLDPNEINGLIPDHLTLLSELNELEQANITKAIRKYLMGRTKNWDIADPLVWLPKRTGLRVRSVRPTTPDSSYRSTIL